MFYTEILLSCAYMFPNLRNVLNSVLRVFVFQAVLIWRIKLLNQGISISEGTRLWQCEVASCLGPLRPSVTYINGIESAGSYNEEGYKVTRLK